MKKKIKDLTLEECRKMCEKNFKTQIYNPCACCPFYKLTCPVYRNALLESEVEVDE